MEVVCIKKVLARNLLIYIGLHCVRRSSWTVTTLATLAVIYMYALIVDKINLYVNYRVLEMTLIMMYILQFGQFSLKLSSKNGRDSQLARKLQPLIRTMT